MLERERCSWSTLNCSADCILHRRSVFKETSSNPTSGTEGTYKEVWNGDFYYLRIHLCRVERFIFFCLSTFCNGLSIHVFKHRFVSFVLKLSCLFMAFLLVLYNLDYPGQCGPRPSRIIRKDRLAFIKYYYKLFILNFRKNICQSFVQLQFLASLLLYFKLS
jgi:hypothetical protein